MSSADSRLSARGRLAVLSAHLAAPIEPAAPVVEPSRVSAQNLVPPPGNLSGSLAVVDERTGRKYRVPVSGEGAVKATDLKQVSLLRCCAGFDRIRGFIGCELSSFRALRVLDLGEFEVSVG